MIHSKKRLFCLVLSLAFFYVKPLLAQQSVKASTDLVASDIAVGYIIEEAQEAVDALMEEAFDRLDQSLMLAANEAGATVNQVAIELAEFSDQTVQNLDGQQRRALSDLKSLTTTITNSIDSSAEDILTPVRHDIQLLLSRNPGYISLTAGIVTRNDSDIELKIKGTALSQAKIVNFGVNYIKVEPAIVESDDNNIVLRIPLNKPPISDILNLDEGEYYEILFTFALEECSWLGLICNQDRKFSVLGYVLPKTLGTVKAIFVGDIDTEERREISRGPFTSDRVKSNWSGSTYGSRNDTWVARPDDGWKIDVKSAKYHFEELNRSCSGARSYASWVEQSEHILRVKARTATDRKPYVTCKTRTKISFTQWKKSPQPHTIETDEAVIEHNGTTALRLDESSGLKNARFLHMVIKSGLFRDETKILRDEHSAGGLKVDYDSATQTAYLHSLLN